jgi:glycosyltransferase involved in cell wall biosynthesis
MPRGYDLYSNDVIPAHMAAWANQNPDAKPLLITLFDTWIFKGEPWGMVDQIASWVPIDHSPVPPDVAAWNRRPNVTPIAMSQFGQDALSNAGIESLYVPHAIEKVYQPTDAFTTPTGPLTGRDFMDIGTDRFVVMMNSANKGRVPNRKSFPEAFLAFSMFAKQHDDAVLYVHTEDRGAMGGIDLRELADAVDIPDEQIRFVDQYAYRTTIPPELLAAVYTAADVLLCPSMGEGFGIPVVEAQACGTPVIVSNFSAQPELVGDGWLVEGQPWWDSAQRSWLVAPQVPSIIEALEAAYQRGQGRSDKAIDYAAQYDADYVYEHHWKPAIELLS